MESVGSHAFKKLGAVAIAACLDHAAPSLHYESPQSWTAQSLSVAHSLIASSGPSGWMFLVAPGLAADNTGRSHGLLYARSDAICAAIEEDVAAQEEEAKDKGEEGPSKKTDLPLTDKVFKFLPVEVRHTARGRDARGEATTPDHECNVVRACSSLAVSRLLLCAGLDLASVLQSHL